MKGTSGIQTSAQRVVSSFDAEFFIGKSNTGSKIDFELIRFNSQVAPFGRVFKWESATAAAFMYKFRLLLR